MCRASRCQLGMVVVRDSHHGLPPATVRLKCVHLVRAYPPYQENPMYLAKMERERIARGETVKDAKGAKKGKK